MNCLVIGPTDFGCEVESSPGFAFEVQFFGFGGRQI